MEPSATMGQNPGVKILAEWWAPIGQRDGAARGSPWIDRRRKKKRVRCGRECTGSARTPSGSARVLNCFGMGAERVGESLDSVAKSPERVSVLRGR